MTYDVNIDGKNYRLELERVDGRWACRVDGRAVEIDAVLARRDDSIGSDRAASEGIPGGDGLDSAPAFA